MDYGTPARLRNRALSLLAFLLLPTLLSAATITVNTVADTTADTGTCALREAIIAANTNTASGATVGECAAGAAGLDTIQFNITTGCSAITGVCTIQPGSVLPTITEAVILNGYTQPGAVMNSLAVGNNAALKIEIDGSNSAPAADTALIRVTAGSSTIMGLIVNRFPDPGQSGIELDTGNGNTIKGNFIGTTADGTDDVGNSCANVRVLSNTNTIGGLLPADRNVISGAVGCGINVVIGGSLEPDASGNQVLNNYIGTDAAGTAALGGAGVDLSGNVTGNSIGNATVAGRNVISSFGSFGIRLDGPGSTANFILGNYIGTAANGVSSLGVNPGINVFTGANGNFIGGDVPGAGNVIAFSLGDGVELQASAGTNNAILGNSIHSNGGLGIDLGSNGVTANDMDDPDTGPNNLQNFPVITTVMPGAGITTIEGTLNSTPSTVFRVQFFSNATCDPSGNGEGRTFLGEATPPVINTDVNGDAVFSVTVPTVVSATEFVTATASNSGPVDKRSAPKSGARLRPLGAIAVTATSEFSACFLVTGGATPTPTLTPTLTPTNTPSSTPTSGPSPTPTNTPTSTPSSTPSSTPTNTPTTTPTLTPSLTPSSTPTLTPTSTGTLTPSFTPTTTFTPTLTPSLTPTSTGTLTPSFTPTTTLTPTLTPSLTPTSTGTLTPSFTPTTTFTPTLNPTSSPTFTPSPTPTVPVGTTPTVTATPTTVPPSATPTLLGGGGGPPGSIPVPTLSEGMLALLALALAGLGFFLIRRS